MRPVWHSFYWRAAAVLFGIAAALGIAGVWLTAMTTRAYQEELEQRLNLQLAANLVKETSVLDDGRVLQENFEQVFHTLMVINPRIEVYLLDAAGRILAFSAGEDVVVRRTVSLDPVRTLLSGRAQLPVRGDDPRHPDRRKIFSAAPVPATQPAQGYLYVVLAGQEYDSAVGMLAQSFVLRLGAGAGLGALLTALAGGLLLFRGLAGRVERLDRRMAEAHGAGVEDDATVTHAEPGDEIARLEASFERMQRTIDAQVSDLRQLDALRRELVANVSHDLRTPLTALQAYLETVLLKGAQLTDAERQSYLESAVRHSEALGRLVAELFDLARLDSGEIRPAVEPFSLAELCQDIAEKFRLAALAQGVSLQASLPHDLPFARGDLGLIERVISNLLDNAIRHTPEGGTVTLRLERANEGLRVEVRDTGRGISAQDLPYIFDRFYRGHDEEARGGAGLGLAIARRIVELHDAVLSVTTPSGQGAAFTFTLAAQ
ncbi:MAG: sensor histidine kinase [Acidobacteria bacterium]|nr:sensor histidine kinase [Acidobacteriota bacterium]